MPSRLAKYLPLCLLPFAAACGSGTSTPPEGTEPGSTQFRLRLENVSNYQQLKSGGFAVAVGKADPGAIAPGEAYEVSFTAARGQRLAFATMLGASNDWVFAPEARGLELFENGAPITGDVTSKVYLWDVGTEVDEEPGVGPHTGPNQGRSVDGPGALDPTRVVRRLEGSVTLTDGRKFTLPAVSAMIRATLDYRNGTFRLRLQNVSDDASTLQTSAGPRPVRISPGVWAVATGTEPLFTQGQPDRGQGLEQIAEMGAHTMLEASLRPRSGVPTGLSQGVLVVHRGRAPLFTLGEPDRGQGLERIAEDGVAETLGKTLKATPPALSSRVAVFDTPVGRENPSAITFGNAYELTFSAKPGDRLSLVTMFGWSNDWFFGTPEEGVELFDGQQALFGPLTGDLRLYDLGTELSEEPGVGPYTGGQQAEPNSGPADTDPRVREVTAREYANPPSHHIKVSLAPVDPT